MTRIQALKEKNVTGESVNQIINTQHKHEAALKKTKELTTQKEKYARLKKL
ncbi:hypothetical protein C2845_PM17G08920 [Panicum miliaceum]|uniref:Uncharacterized protein n=1 Tax=Panicum miliaceum TaxID=4540 RepID=A0A3L6Q3S1_PANMI|nr:hypothetical protein C2845_PM17G08920 [Panicum miliaceum]